MSKFARQTATLALILMPAGLLPADGAPADGAQSIPQLGCSNCAWQKVLDDFDTPLTGPGPVVHEKDHPYRSLRNNRRDQPTFRVADLTNPILKPWVIEQMRQKNELALAGKEAYEARASCHPGGVPGFLVMGKANPLYIVQGPKEVLLMNQGGPEVRHIYLDVPHTANPKIMPYGESVGHYEGDTLVVDTVALRADTYIDNYRTPHTTQEHVIERYRLADGGKTMQVDIRVEDPGAFNMAWSARQAYKLSNFKALDGRMLEAICSENNEVLSSFAADATVSAIPKADKPDF